MLLQRWPHDFWWSALMMNGGDGSGGMIRKLNRAECGITER